MPENKNVTELYARLVSTTNASADDAIKAASGKNKAAGTRVRKAMQEVKAIATDIRKAVLEDQKE